ncbi:P4B major core protein [Salmon gill poxvirus]
MSTSKCFCGKHKFHPISLNKLGLPDCNYFAISSKNDDHDLVNDMSGGMTTESNLLDMDTASLNSTLDSDVLVDHGMSMTQSSTDFAPVSHTIHGMTCGANCPTCALVNSCKLYLSSDTCGGAAPVKKKVTKKAGSDTSKKPEKFASVQDLASSIENVDVSVKRLASYIFTKLKGVVSSGKLTLQQISDLYVGQDIRLSEESFKRMVNMVVKMFKEQSTGTPWNHVLNVIRYKGKDSNVIKTELKNLDVIAENNDYNQITELSIYQSSEFSDISDFENGLLVYGGPMDSINPILVAMFGVKMAGFENCSVRGDSYSLVKQLYHGGTVDETNIALLNSRFIDTPDDRVYLNGTTDEISTEIQRIILHMSLRKILLRVRSGDFKRVGSMKAFDWIHKMTNMNGYNIRCKEDKTLDMCLRVLGHKSFIIKQSGGGMTSCPFVTIPVHEAIDLANDNIGIGNDVLSMIDYNNFTKRFEMKPLHKTPVTSNPGLFPVRFPNEFEIGNQFNHMAPHFNHLLQNPLVNQGHQMPGSFAYNTSNGRSSITGTGTMVFFIERQKTVRSMDKACFSYGRNSFGMPLMYDKKITTEYGTTYYIKSAVCYRPKEFSGFGQPIVEGSPCFTILFTKKGPWIYDPYDSVSGTGRDQTMTRALMSMWTRDTADGKGVNDYDTWLALDPLAPMIAAKKSDIANGKKSFVDGLISDELAHDLIGSYCCILMYSQDVDSYKNDNMTSGLVIKNLTGCCLA